VKAAELASKAGAYFMRATRLRCPVCGCSPLFPPALRVRRFFDWVTPFDGCPRCGFAYEREPGYFLMAVWVVNCAVGSLLGLLSYLVLRLQFELPVTFCVAAMILVALVCDVLFLRHAKAYFLALDHLFDPHEKGGGDDRGNQPFEPEPDPTEPCETRPPMR
jgi:uncharacterized protein (DUF983 family)